MADQPVLNSDQKAAFKAIHKFLQHPTANVFVLKGYAGTGKTFLMQRVAKWLEEKEKKFNMLAATGRAATVLRGKTGFTARTVHSEVYNFSKIDGIDEHHTANSVASSNAQMTLQFTTRQPDKDPMIYIVDEASMLSAEMSQSDNFAVFGSGMLLNDFFEVAGKNKIIFVGDPCQLPPVGSSFSPALDVKWLEEQGHVAVLFTLTTVERTKDGNDILVLAGDIRQMREDKEPTRFPKLPAANLKNVKLHSTDRSLFAAYAETYQASGTNTTLAIARSNKMVMQINRAMRRELFGSEHEPLRQGDVLLVTQNNYAAPLTNGDFVIIDELGEIKTKATLKFQKVRITALASGKEFSIMLSLDALNSIKGNLSNDDSKYLMMDFNTRMREKGISANTESYREAMREDEYLNCLKASYGYAVTCHKAQGGEWNDVYLFLEKSMYGMPYPELCNWWYTATTRAREQLNLVNNWWIG